MKLNNLYFYQKINEYKASFFVNKLSQEEKQSYINNYILLLLLKQCRDLKYNMDNSYFNFFILDIYFDIINFIKNNKKFTVNFILENQDIILEN